MNKLIKTKAEILLFSGYILLTISFFSMVWYFKRENTALEQEKLLFKKEKEANASITQLGLESKKDSATVIKINQEKTTAQNIIKSSFENINAPVYIQVGSESTKLKLEKINFIGKLSEQKYNVINAYDIELNRADNTVRYFNKEDEVYTKNLVNKINDLFKNENIILKPKYVKLTKVKVPKEQVEIWIK